jgi:hypothetical protein|nr:MAG TPA: hypothetical protein [Caudoviricetes sp.]
MGRGNYYASGDYAAQWYVEYEPDILEEAFREIEERFPFFHKQNKWIRRDSHVLLANSLFYIGIADNEHTIAVFLSSKDDGVTDGLAARHFETYKKGILNILLSFFDEVYVPTSSCTSQKMQSV